RGEGTGGGRVLDRPAGEVERSGAGVVELDEVVLEDGPRVPAPAVDLADDGMADGRRWRVHGEADRRGPRAVLVVRDRDRQRLDLRQRGDGDGRIEDERVARGAGEGLVRLPA